MQIKEGKLTDIEYTDSKGDETNRTVIPVYVPGTAVRTLDVSDVDPDVQQELCNLVEQYKEYRKTLEKQTFGLADFATHINPDIDESVLAAIKWRSFSSERIQVLEE